MTDDEGDFPDELSIEPVEMFGEPWVPYYISNSMGTMLTYVPYSYMEENVLHTDDNDTSDFRIK